MKIKYIFVALVLLLSVFFGEAAVSGLEDRRFESERLVLAKKIRDVLIERGECESLIDCQKKRLFFVSPYEGGVSVQLWGVKDDIAIRGVVQECSNLFFGLDRKVNLVINLYKETKEEDLNSPIWRFNKAITTIEYKGDI